MGLANIKVIMQRAIAWDGVMGWDHDDDLQLANTNLFFSFCIYFGISASEGVGYLDTFGVG